MKQNYKIFLLLATPLLIIAAINVPSTKAVKELCEPDTGNNISYCVSILEKNKMLNLFDKSEYIIFIGKTKFSSQTYGAYIPLPETADKAAQTIQH